MSLRWSLLRLALACAFLLLLAARADGHLANPARLAAATQPAKKRPCRCYSPGARGPLSVLVFPKGVNRVVIKLSRMGPLLLTNAVRINGRRLGWFIIDTGADVTILNTTIPLAAHLPAIISDAVIPAADRHDFRLAKSFSVGPLRLENQAVLRFNLAKLQANSPQPLAGVLGGNFWGKAPFTIDYQRNELLIYRPRSFQPPSNGTLFPLTFRRSNSPISRYGRANPVAGRPLVAGRIGSVPCQIVLDTGWAPCGVALLPGFTRRHPEFVNLAARRQSDLGDVVSDGTPYPAKIPQVHALGAIFTKSLRNAIAYVMVEGERYAEQTTNQKMNEAVLGVPILKRYRLTFDYATRSLWLQKRPHISMAKALAQGLKPNQADLDGQTPLMAACYGGRVRAAKTLLTAGANPLARDSQGCTVLYSAIWSGKAALVKLLLQSPARQYVNVASKTGETPLMLAAATTGDVPIAKLLLAAGANPNSVDKRDLSPLCRAARTRSLPMVSLLLKAGANVNIVTMGHATALSIAAYYGRIAVFKRLLQAGANLKLAPHGYTVLHAAAMGGHARMITFLLGHAGQMANVNRPTDGGLTPLMLAALKAHLAACRILVAAGARIDQIAKQKSGSVALDMAAETDDAPLVQLLVKQGANVNASNADGLTPLMFAANYGNDRVITALLNLGANVNAVGPSGFTPLLLAIRHRHALSASLLVRRGANVNLVAAWHNSEFTALLLASADGTPAMVKYLLKHGALVNFRMRDGWFPLAVATTRNKIGNACALLCRGANPNQTMTKKVTPLDIAAQLGHCQIARDLILAGANVNARDVPGSTALDFACGAGHARVAKLLLAARADPRLADRAGRSAYGYALMGHSPKMIHVLRTFEQAHPRVKGHAE